MRQVFLLITLLFSGFMCGQKPPQKPNITPRLTITLPPEKAPSPVAESLKVSREKFREMAAQLRASSVNRNSSLEVIQPLNPTYEVLSKKTNPPQ